MSDLKMQKAEQIWTGEISGNQVLVSLNMHVVLRYPMKQ